MSTRTKRAAQLPEPPEGHRAAQAAAGPVVAAAGRPPGGVLTREILAPAVVVVLGAIMTILDATIVNVALPVHDRLAAGWDVPLVGGRNRAGRAFGASFAAALAISALGLIPALLLPGRPAGPPSQLTNT